VHLEDFCGVSNKLTIKQDDRTLSAASLFVQKASQSLISNIHSCDQIEVNALRRTLLIR
jgi:hypothetical protein